MNWWIANAPAVLFVIAMILINVPLIILAASERHSIEMVKYVAVYIMFPVNSIGLVIFIGTLIGDTGFPWVLASIVTISILFAMIMAFKMAMRRRERKRANKHDENCDGCTRTGCFFRNEISMERES